MEISRVAKYVNDVNCFNAGSSDLCLQGCLNYDCLALAAGHNYRIRPAKDWLPGTPCKILSSPAP